MKNSVLPENTALRLLGCSRLQDRTKRIRVIVVFHKNTAQEVPCVGRRYFAQSVMISIVSADSGFRVPDVLIRFVGV